MDDVAVDKPPKSIDEDTRSEPVVDDGLKNSSKAIFKLLNPEGKAKLKQREVLQYMKSLHDGEQPSNNNSSALFRKAAKNIQNRHVKKVIHKVIGAKKGKSLKENDMVLLNKRFMSGHLPRLGRDPTEQQEQEEEDSDDEEENEDEDLKREVKKRDGFIYKSIGYSLRSAQMLKNYMVNAVSKAGTTWLISLLPTSQMSTLFTFLLFSYVITASFLSWFIPLAILCFSMGIMVVSTMRIVRGMKRFAEFKAWAEFLDLIGDEDEPESKIDTSQAEENYIFNHVSPYTQLLISSAFCVMAYGVSNKVWLLNAELGILSLIMYGAAIYAHSMHKNLESSGILICQMISTLLEGFHRSEGGQVYGHLLSFECSLLGVVVNLSLPVLLRSYILFSLITMPRQKSFRNIQVGIIQGVLPHVVALVWWEVAAMFLNHCTVYSVIRASFEYLMLLFAMPLFSLIIILAALRVLLTLEITKLVITVGLIVVPLVYFKVWGKRKEMLKIIRKVFGAQTTQALLIMLGSIAFGWMLVSYRPSGMLVSNSNLTWNEYRNVCFATRKLYPGNSVPVNSACREFNGYVVEWEGTVKYVQVTEIDNKVESLLNILPGSVASWLSCVYGKPYPTGEECSKTNSSVDTALCSIASHARRQCHLQDYNLYKFSVGVIMPKEQEMVPKLDDGIIVNVDVSHDFRQVVFELRKGNPLTIKGVLTSPKPSLSAKVLYTSTEGEVQGHVKRHKRIERSLGRMVDEAVNSLTTFLFYPAITFPDVEANEE